MKHCGRCDQAKPLTEFHMVKGKPKAWCKVCWRTYNTALRRKWSPERRTTKQLRDRLCRHGLTDERYGQMVAAQGGRCAACGDTPSDHFVIDHDHACCPGQYSCGACVRALLCKGCNSALGMIRDDPNRALALAMYLLQHRDVLAHAGGESDQPR